MSYIDYYERLCPLCFWKYLYVHEGDVQGVLFNVLVI